MLHTYAYPCCFCLQKQSKWAAREKDMDPKIKQKWENRKHQQYISYMQTYADSLKAHSKKRLMSFREVAVVADVSAEGAEGAEKEQGT